MNQDNPFWNDDPVAVIPQLAKRLDDIRQSRNELDEDFLTAELSVNETIAALDAVGQRLKRIKGEPKRASTPVGSPPVAAPAAPAASPGGMTLEEFKASMGTILQGSLDQVSEKLSGKISGMLKELGTLSGPAREIKFQELKQAADYEMVDFSTLFSHEQVPSNLCDVGVEEKESKSIDANLERLRRMRAGKPKAEEK